MGTGLHRSPGNGTTQSPAHAAWGETGGAKLHHMTGTHVSLVRFGSYRLSTITSSEHRGAAAAASALYQPFIHRTGLPCPFREVLI